MPENCTKCDDPIRDTTVTFEKKPYHPECFVCHQCQKKLSGKSIFQHEGHNYDEECYSECHAKKCAVCEKPLTETNVKFVVYGGEQFHKDCFTCSSCHKSLSGEKFFTEGDRRICTECKAIYKHEGHNYDQECYSIFHAKKCAICYKSLTETNVKFVVYDGKQYHKDCFTCYSCRKSLSGEKFYLDNDKRYCKDCMK